MWTLAHDSSAGIGLVEPLVLGRPGQGIVIPLVLGATSSITAGSEGSGHATTCRATSSTRAAGA